MFTCLTVVVRLFWVQTTGFQDEGQKVRTRPPVCGPKHVKAQRAWLSAQGEDSTLIHKPQKLLVLGETNEEFKFIQY